MADTEKARLYEMVGALKAMKAISGYVDAARFSMYRQLKDSGFYKQLGMDWKTFCKDVLKSSQNSINEEIRLLEELGVPFMEAAERIGLNKRQLLLFGRTVSAETASIDGEIIKLGERQFKISELADNEAEFKQEMGLYSRELAVTKKELKLAQAKLAGIDGEHKKSEKTLLKKIEDLESLAGTPDTPEKVLAGFTRIDNIFNDLDMAVRIFCWKDAKEMIAEDPALQAKVEGIQQQMRSRVDGLIRDWDSEINNDQ